MKNIALISLGCAKNLVDSEVMLGYLANDGYTFVSQPKDADIIIINTCGFIQPAKNEAVDSIRMALDLKKNKRHIKVFVTGCYIERNSEELEEQFPGIDGWLGVNDFDKIVQVVEGKAHEKAAFSFLYDHQSPPLPINTIGMGLCQNLRRMFPFLFFLHNPSHQGLLQIPPYSEHCQ